MMAYTQEDFQEWIFFISDKLDYMTDTFAKENGLNLDLSVESIDALERVDACALLVAARSH